MTIYQNKKYFKSNFNYCAFINDFVNVIKEYYKGQKEPCFIKNIKKNYKY